MGSSTGKPALFIIFPENTREFPEMISQGYVNGGFQTVVRVLSGDRIPLPPFYLNLTSLLPQCYLILTSFLPLFNLNLTSASSGISNHGLETTVYRPLDFQYWR